MFIKSFTKKGEIVDLRKLIIYLLIYFDERQKEISSVYIYHVIFGLTIGLLLSVIFLSGYWLANIVKMI